MEKKSDLLAEIDREIEGCKACLLYKSRTHVVPGEGNPEAEIFFIGEGPGKNEDIEGRPFVGAAGKFLEVMLQSVGLKREDVFIGNVIKCRPSMNRDPEPIEIETCKDYLFEQLNIIKPKIICTLGRFSLGLMLPGESISGLHGQPKRLIFKSHDHPLHELGEVILLPLYHPAVALYRGSMRELLLNDISKIPTILKQLKEKSPTK